MAVRCGHEPQAEADPDWLSDPPPTKAAKPQPERIPLPATNTSERPSSNLDTGSNLQPQADLTPADTGAATAKPALGEGFKLRRERTTSAKADDSSKPALPGLETPAEKSPGANRDDAAPPLAIPDNP